jgi:hypothetical protein
MEMEAQTSKRKTKLVIFAWPSNFNHFLSHQSYEPMNHMLLGPSHTASLAQGLIGVNKALSWIWKLKHPNA